MTSSISLASLLAADTTSVAAATSSWADIRNGVLASVSSELGLSQSDLTTQLKAGKSMADVAKANGISSSDLTATIKGALQQDNLPAGINLDQMALRMANNVNNASIDDDPVTPATSAATSTSTSSGLGIDTSSVDTANFGGLSLSTSEISMLLGGATGTTLDTYL